LFLARGALGPLRVVRCRDIRAARERPAMLPPPWRLKKAANGGGILMNWGCYDLDYLLGITGWTLRPRLALAQTWTIPPAFAAHVVPDSDAETHYAALVLCEGGTVLTMERGEYMAASSDEAWQIIGADASLTRKMTGARPKVLTHDRADAERGVVSETLWQGDETGSAHNGPTTDFAQAIRGNRQPMTSLEQALVVQQISDAIYASAQRGAAVEIS
jgi:predicted dehydrogenase